MALRMVYVGLILKLQLHRRAVLASLVSGCLCVHLSLYSYYDMTDRHVCPMNP